MAFRQVRSYAIVAAAALALAGCSTMEGLGKDTQKAGEWVEKKASGKDDKKSDE